MTIYDADGNRILDVEVDDSSYRYRAIMGDHSLTLKFSLAVHREIPVGATCVYQGQTYTLARPEALTMHHTRSFDYTAVFEADQYRAGIWKFRNLSDGRVKFSLTARPSEHLQLLVDNLNARDGEGVWETGECIDHDEVCVCYDHAYCIEALSQMAEAFDTEWEVDGRTVSLHKVEYGRDDPLEMEYGRGKGFKPEVGRGNSSDDPPVEVLYAQGGGDNIDMSKYPQELHKNCDRGDGSDGTYGGDGTGNAQNNNSAELLLPPGREIGYDGETFFYKDEEGWDGEDVRHYVVDDQGYSVRRSDRELETKAEDSLDCSEIYPKRVGTVSMVMCMDKENNFYDFWDDEIAEGGESPLDYNQYLMDGETMTVIFQSGELAGREFEISRYYPEEGRFAIVPDEIDGMIMPGEPFVPKEGDTYAVFGCMLPSEYICDDAGHSGAEWDMLRECVRYFYDNEEQKFTFTGKMDGIWSAGDWDNIGGKVRLGGYILFRDERFQEEGVLVRIVGVKDYINSPHSPELELSNETVSPGFASTVKDIESREMLVDERHRDSIQFTKRRFRDAQETMELLEQTVNSLSGQFTEGVSPVSVQTMTMLVGDDALQFRFVTGFGSTTADAHSVTWDVSSNGGTLEVEEGYLQHLTIGVTTVTNSEGRASQEYRTWHIPEAKLTPDDTGARWLYAVVPQDTAEQEGVFRLEKEAVGMSGTDDDGNAVYNLLVGILNGEYGGDRSFAQMYGYTEVSPGRITTGRIVSGDGSTYFDLDLGEVGGRIDFRDGLISGVIGIGDGEGELKAGLSAEGGFGSSVRIWAGSESEGRDTAAFRVTQDGSLYASKGTFSGFLRVPFVNVADVFTKTDGVYDLDGGSCNLLFPLTAAGYSVRLPYDGDDPSRTSGLVFNLFLYYKAATNETLCDTLTVNAGGGFIWWYSEDGAVYHAAEVEFSGGYVQLTCIGDNEWVISINGARGIVVTRHTIDNPTLTASPTSVTFPSGGGDAVVEVSTDSNLACGVVSAPDWIACYPGKDAAIEMTDGTGTLKLTAAANDTGDDRSGTVVIEPGKYTGATPPAARVQVSQTASRTLTIGWSFSSPESAPAVTVTFTANGITEIESFSSPSGAVTRSYDGGTEVAWTLDAAGHDGFSGEVVMDRDVEITRQFV